MCRHGIFLSLLILLTTPKTFAQTADTTISLYFASGNSNPNASEIAAAATRIKTMGGKIKMIYGYADSVGTPAANRRLSSNRCVSVIRILEASGFGASIGYEGRGELKNADNETLAASRRVDIHVSYAPPVSKQVATNFGEQISHLDLNDIQFLPDVPAMEPASLLYLPGVLAALNTYHHAHFEIIGYVNWITNHPQNRNSGYAKKMQELSAGRAKAVYEWLADNGIDRSRMSYEGKSNDSLIFNNPATDKEKERNMRVQIIIRDSLQRPAGKR